MNEWTLYLYYPLLCGASHCPKTHQWAALLLWVTCSFIIKNRELYFILTHIHSPAAVITNLRTKSTAENRRRQLFGDLMKNYSSQLLWETSEPFFLRVKQVICWQFFIITSSEWTQGHGTECFRWSRKKKHSQMEKYILIWGVGLVG